MEEFNLSRKIWEFGSMNKKGEDIFMWAMYALIIMSSLAFGILLIMGIK